MENITDIVYLGDDLSIGYDQDRWMFIMWCGPQDNAYSIIWLEDPVAERLFQYLKQRRK